MFPKNKQNKLRQTKKKREIKKESHLNYTIVIKYAFCSFCYFSSNKIAQHT